MLSVRGHWNTGLNYFCILYEVFFFFSSNSWGHKTGIYTQLQSDNDGHTKTGYDVKASLVINNSLEPMEVQESDSTNILFPKSILVQ